EKGAAALSYMGEKANQILDVIQDPLGAAKTALSTAWDAAKSGWSKAQSVMGPLWEATKEKVVQAGQALNESVLQPALEFAKEKGQQAMAYMKERFPGLANCFEVAIDLAGQATEFVSEKMEQAGAWVTEHYDKLSMAGHLMLDGLGMVPGFGAIADGLNAVWYLAEGNYTDAAMSALAAIPGIGDAAAAGKMGKRASQMMRGLDKVGDAMGGLKSGLTAAGKGIPGIPPKGLMQAADSARSAVNKLPPLPPAAGRIADEAGLAAKDFTMETMIAVGQVYASGEEMTPERMKQIVATSATGAVVARGVDNVAEKAIGGAQRVLGRNRPGGNSGGVDIDTPNSGGTRAEASGTTAIPEPSVSRGTTDGDVSVSPTRQNQGDADVSSTSTAPERAPTDNSATQTSEGGAESPEVAVQARPELQEGLSHDPKAREIVENNPQIADDLVATQPKSLNELTPQQRKSEVELAAQLPRKRSDRDGYEETVELPNDHEWEKTKEGQWCRFSENENCSKPGDLVPGGR
ncbi:MAG: hypothetical protein AAFP03_18340, partial [Cyanobacteria bacterium J06598_3]